MEPNKSDSPQISTPHDLTDGDESPFVAIGRTLREQREQQNRSIADLVELLRLPGVVIEDLEAGRSGCLAPLYRRGYVANYARALGLDPTPMLHLLGANRPAQQAVLPSSSVTTNRRRPRSDTMLKFATYVIATTVIVPPLIMIYLSYGASLFDSAGRGEEPVSPISAATGEPTERHASTELDSPIVRHLSASTLPLPGMRASQMVKESTVLAAPASGPENDAATAQDSVFELTVRLVDDSWVEITDSEETRLEYDLLRDGRVVRYAGQPPLRVLLGRGNAVELEFAGQPLSFAGHDRPGLVEFSIDEHGRIIP